MGTPVNEILATNLKGLMENSAALNTQAKLAERAKVDQKTISNCLNPGQRRSSTTGRTPSPTLAQVEKIATAFGLNTWELLRPAVLTTQRAPQMASETL
jgi:transcriptional regulator with XRE-family HTH domain